MEMKAQQVGVILSITAHGGYLPSGCADLYVMNCCCLVTKQNVDQLY